MHPDAPTRYPILARVVILRLAACHRSISVIIFMSCSFSLSLFLSLSLSLFLPRFVFLWFLRFCSRHRASQRTHFNISRPAFPTYPIPARPYSTSKTITPRIPPRSHGNFKPRHGSRVFILCRRNFAAPLGPLTHSLSLSLCLSVCLRFTVSR